MGWRAGWRRFGVAGLVTVAAVVVAAGVGAGAGDAPVTVVGVQPETPDVSGQRMVWADSDSGSYDVFLYDSASGTTLKIASTADDEVEPSISGDTVVYTRRTAAGADIYAYNIASKQTAVVSNAAGDQISPSISGTYVAWEDHATGYHGQIWGRDLASGAPFKIDSGYNAELTRPKVGGSVVVYQIRPGGLADDADVKAYDFVTRTFTSVAATDADEMLPATDGRYVAWVDSSAGDMDIKAYDMQSGATFAVRTQAGEQTLPCVAGGVVYWVDSSVGKRLHVDTFDIASGTFSAFDNRSASDMVAVSAEGSSIAWLETKGAAGWQVKAYLTGSPAVNGAGGILPVSTGWSPFRLAQISTGGDGVPPEIVETAVGPGATRVAASADLTVYFSEPLDARSVTAASVALRDEASGESVDATVRYSALAEAVSVEPVEALAEGTYTLHVDVGIADKAGNHLVEPIDITFGTGGSIAADTVTPTKPGGPWARPDGTGAVEVSWTRSSDNVGVTEYRVYRCTTPGAALTQVGTADGAAMSLSVPKAADETVPKKYTYYYAVRAYDAAGNFSTLSSYTAPDPHGTYIYGQQVNNCTICHSVHGATPTGAWALGAQSAEACYGCHGSSSASTGHGYGSTKDAQAAFWDYEDTPLPDGGTRHRNAFMESQRQECDACHTPHKKPYNEAAGVKDPATSYSKLLKSPTDPGDAGSTLVYSTDAAPFGQVFCFACHGSASGGALTYMTAKGGAEAYSNTAGDHNQAQYDAAGNPGNVAHDDEVVLYTQRNGVTNPGSQANCAACHDEHATATGSLADYRRSGTTATTYKQAGLCFACHSASSVETRSVGSVPFAWNGRDVKAQFQKTSKHPTTALTSAPVPEAGSWLQTLQADFNTDALTDTVATAGDSVELAPVDDIFVDDFEDGTITEWTRSGDWSATQSWSSPNWSIQGGGTAFSAGTEPDTAQSAVLDASDRTNVVLSFDYQRVGIDAGEWMYVDYSTDGGSSYDPTPLWSLQGNGTTSNGTAAGIALPVGTDRIRLRVTGADANEYGRWDNIVVSADTAFTGSGNVVSTPILVTGGTLNSWTDLRFNGSEPVGTQLVVDILDGGDSSVIVGDLTLADSPYSLAAIDEAAHPSLKLRARFVGDIPAPASISDDFADGSFDTAMWTDRFLNSDDPDVPPIQNELDEGFENDPGWQTNFPAVTGTWERSTLWDPVGIYDIRGGNGGTNPALLTSRAMDLTGWTNVTVAFQWQRAALDTGEYMRVQYSTDGSSWTDLWSIQGSGGTSAGTQTGLSIPSPNATTYVRLRVEGADFGEWGYWDAITVSGNPPATNDWPKELGGTLTLRAEGTNFGGTADEGEFAYVTPSQATWIATDDFDMVVRVPSYDNQGSNGWMKAGLMVRTGTTEANAYATGAKMAGIYVTDTNGVVFEYRTAAGGSTSAEVAGSGDVPVYLRLSRRGDTLTGYKSGDGSTWTEVGSQSVTLDANVLAGIALTSHVNGAYSEATFDDFGVTQVTDDPSPVTPRLDDWTVDYVWTPSPAGAGRLTCYNCHNTHYVQKGTAGAGWSMSRASDPDNSKTVYAGSVTSFCLRCHDGAPPAAVTNQSNTLVPYDVLMTDTSAYPFFPGWNKSAANVEWTAGGHASTGVMTIGCENCHDPHASDNARLTAYTRDDGGGAGVPANPRHNAKVYRDNSSTFAEEKLCYGCHATGANVPRSSVEPIGQMPPSCTQPACHPTLMDIYTPFAATYSHPIGTSGAHSDTEDASGLGAGNRHAECADCHDPHATRPGIHADNSSAAGNVLRGATGVKPTTWPPETSNPFQSAWDAWNLDSSDYSAVRMDGESGDYEAYTCLKCHSSYTTQPASYTRNSLTYTPTDVAREFNPNNQSGHNVLGQVWPKTSFVIGGNTYTWSLWSGGFQAGYSTSEMLTCTSCHEGEGTASGPHGSSRPYLIDSAYATAWNSTGANLNSSNGLPTTLICYKCHNNIRSINTAHQEHDSRGNEGGYCRFCHVGVPHGWKRPRLIGYTTDADPYATWRSSSGQTPTGNYGLTEIQLRSYTPSGWDRNDCYAGCSSSRHPNQSNPWP